MCANTPLIDPASWPCRRCGACCRVEGYVRLTQEDVRRLAAHAGMTEDAFVNAFTRLTADRRGLSLTEQAEDGACVFLDDTNGCLVNDAKPAQCRAFPLRWNFAGYEAICAAARGLVRSPTAGENPRVSPGGSLNA